MTNPNTFIEGTPFFRTKTGIDQYAVNLVDHLARLSPAISYTVVGFWDDRAKPRRENLHYRFAPIPRRLYMSLAARFLAPPLDLLTGQRPDVFIYPNYSRYPLVLGGKSVTIIYDLSFVLHPEYVDEDNRRYLTRAVASAVARSDHLITISQNSRREIVEQYGVDPGKITVALPAADAKLFFPRRQDEITAVTRRYLINGPYVLFTGTLEPRKNLRGVLGTWQSLPRAITDHFSLVLAGQKGWLDQQLLAAIDTASRAGAKIVQTGYVPDADLPSLYSGAAVFLYPSHYEGFGMPPLEAMACGTPVVTSNNSSLPEVVGDAGIMVDADDTNALAAAVEGILTDPKRAGDLRARGVERAKQFTWESSAKGVLEVLERIDR